MADRINYLNADYYALDCSPFYNKKGECLINESGNAISDSKSFERVVNAIRPSNILIVGIDNKTDDNDHLIFRPYQSFARSPQWTAGRYVGDMTVEHMSSDYKNGRLVRSRVSIYPRFGISFLIRMLEEIYDFRMPESITSMAKGDTWNNIYQLIMRQLWIAKFAKADKYGLPRQTITRQHKGMQIRGHLNVGKSVIPFFAKKEVVSEYREKELDDIIGKIVYKAFVILADKKTGLTGLPPHVQESINDLYSRYHGLQIKISEHDYQSIHYKNIYQGWKPLVDFSWQIIKHRGFDMDRSIDEQGYALFFDMAEIWEAYIASILKGSFQHYTENNSHFSLFEDYQQTIIPDYISRDYDESSNNATAVADAKYMRLYGQNKLQGEQSYSVYYKTIMYMLRFNAKKGFIFYPYDDASELDEGKDFVSHKIMGTDSNLIVAGLKIPKYEASTGKEDNADESAMSFYAFHEKMEDIEDRFVAKISSNL